MVLAESRALAEDAAELIEVDYEPLVPVTDVVAGAAAGAPLIHADVPGNLGAPFRAASAMPSAPSPRPTSACASASTSSATSGMPMETRGVVAQWDQRDGSLTTWNSTQVVHFVQQGLVAALGLPAHKIRVIAPDVGGGFGTKANGYPEDLLIPGDGDGDASAGEVDGGPARAHDGRGPCPPPGA